MVVFLHKPMPGGPGQGTVQLLARMEADFDGRRIVGHIAQVIGPGWVMFGRAYEEWAALPAGPHEIPEGADFSDDRPGAGAVSTSRCCRGPAGAGA